MSLTIGDRLAHYDVTAKLGEGGMGEVWRATDTQLDRDVALKVLPEAFTSDPDRLARFEREAKVLASLNHPGIAAIYGIEEDDDTRALVLELVEGPTLADRISKGPIPLDEALPIAKQIAEALEAAHEAGVIHRDLKPANIKVREDGTVKVLDFGLAKALDTTPAGDPSESPTLTAAATQMGVVLGTAAYMSPEQASGDTVDKRSDIWSFGVVLFEMLTGRRLFDGKTIAHVMSAVIQVDPKWDTLPTAMPQPMTRLLRRCLQKERQRRLRDIGDALTDLDEALIAPPGGGTVSAGVAQPAGRRRALPWAAGIALAVATGVAVWTLRPAPTQPASRFSVSVPPSVAISLSISHNDVAISPDGTHVVYRAEGDVFHVRTLNQLEGVPLRGTENAFQPFLSPDGTSVGFMAGLGGAMQKVSILGGPPVTICEMPADLRGASWGLDDVIVFGTASGSGLMRVSGAGGEPEAITSVEGGRHQWPDILPGGVGVLFVISRAPGPDDNQIAVLDMDTGEHRVIIPTGSHPRYSPTGHIVYGVEGTLRAVAFDLETLEVGSDPTPVLEGVVMKGSGVASFDLSDTGSLVYVSGDSESAGAVRTFVLVDRDGQEEALALPPRNYSSPRLSPDGTRLEVTVGEPDGVALWVYDVASGRGLRLTQEGIAVSPVWTPDGERIVFGWILDGGPPDLYWVPADGSSDIENLVTSDEGDFPTAVTPDGRTLLFSRQPGNGQEIWQVPLEGERNPTPWLQGEFRRGSADVSPDGRWVAYRSNESGEMEAYVEPYPGPGARVIVSSGGGQNVVWSPDGSELFYRRLDGQLMVVGMRDDGSVGTPTELFEGNYVAAGPGGTRLYHIAPDGRFLMMRSGDAQAGEDEPLAQVVLVLNWFEELRRLVPVP